MSLGYDQGMKRAVSDRRPGPGVPRSAAVLLLSLLLSAPACAGGRMIAGAPGQTGIASWYGPDFHGRLTSNREVYDMYDMTAAHPTLPFGTRVMVTNLDNGRAAEVRINDRGPFVKERIIDLSYAAARMLGMIGPGTAPVRLDILNRKDWPPAVGMVIQVGSFTNEQNARRLQAELGRRFGETFISTVVCSGRVFYRVRIKVDDRSGADLLAGRLSASGYPVLICEAD